MKTMNRSRRVLPILVVVLVAVLATAGVWNYRTVQAVKVDTSGGYVSIDMSFSAGEDRSGTQSVDYAGSAVGEKSTNYYEIDYPGSGGKIGIGDTAGSSNFKPDLTIGTWNGEAEFKLIAPAAMEEKSQLAASIAGDTVSASNGEWAFEYKPTEPKAGFNDNGGIDIFITAKNKPASSAIEFTYASGTVSPYHEPPLSVQYKDGWSDEFQADIKVTETQVSRVKDGVTLVSRPEYVVNSIAFYADNKSGDITASGGKNYRTGKVGHLYRMKAVDSAGKSAWFDWSMPSQTQIRLTDTTGILQTGAYPITIQPVGDTFGYTAAGGSYSCAFNRIVGSGLSFSPAQNGTATSMSVYTYGYANVQLALSTGTLYGSHTILGNTGHIYEGGAGPAQWASGNLVSSVPVYSSTAYYLLYNQGDSGAIYFDSASGGNYEALDQTYNTWPSPVSLGNWGAVRRFSIYCSYTPGASPSISNSPSSRDFGVVNPSAVVPTGLSYFTVTNNSGSAVNITIGGTDLTGGTPWTLSDAGTPGVSTAAMKAGLSVDYNIVVRKTAPYNILRASLSPSASQTWGLQLLAPTNYTDSVQKSGTVTLTASTP